MYIFDVDMTYQIDASYNIESTCCQSHAEDIALRKFEKEYDLFNYDLHLYAKTRIGKVGIDAEVFHVKVSYVVNDTYEIKATGLAEAEGKALREFKETHNLTDHDVYPDAIIEIRIRKEINMSHSQTPWSERTMAHILHDGHALDEVPEEVIEIQDGAGITIGYIHDPSDAKLAMMAPKMLEFMETFLSLIGKKGGSDFSAWHNFKAVDMGAVLNEMRYFVHTVGGE